MVVTNRSNSRPVPFATIRRKSSQKEGEDTNLTLARAVFDTVMEKIQESSNRMQQQLQLSESKNAFLVEEENKQLVEQVREVLQNKLEEFDNKLSELYQKELPQKIEVLVKSLLPINSDLGEVFTKELPIKVKELADNHLVQELQTFEKSLTIRNEQSLGLFLDKEFDRRVGGLVTKFVTIQEANQKLDESFRQGLKSFEEYHRKDLDDKNQQINELKSLVVVLQKRLDESEITHTKQLDLLREFITALPIPQIFVPPDAIQINQLPSVVNNQMIVPQESLRVEVNQLPSVVNVTTPEQPSIVNINVPEQKTPEVHVNIPPEKLHKVRKEIQYDSYGRPATILERDEPETPS